MSIVLGDGPDRLTVKLSRFGDFVAALIYDSNLTARTVTDGATTNADATVTSATAAFTTADEGASISGAGIPVGATIASINSATSVEISTVATASGSGVSLTITPTNAWPAGTVIDLRFYATETTLAPATTWTTTITGDRAEWNIDKTVVASAVLDPGNETARLFHTKDGIELEWAKGVTKDVG